MSPPQQSPIDTSPLVKQHPQHQHSMQQQQQQQPQQQQQQVSRDREVVSVVDVNFSSKTIKTLSDLGISVHSFICSVNFIEKIFRFQFFL